MTEEFIAKINGEPWVELPENLYIPPDALEVFLEMFEGPLDLLLYLVRQQNIDILDIPIAQITRQYFEYIQLMRALRYDLASEYLVMASMLAEIKSRMMLPQPVLIDDEEEDPRAELVRKLQAYETVKRASAVLDEQPILDRDVFRAHADAEHLVMEPPLPALQWQQLTKALSRILERVEHNKAHHVERAVFSVNQRVKDLRHLLNQAQFVAFEDCFTAEEGRGGVVVSFLSVLELIRYGYAEIIQRAPLEPLYLRRVEVSDGAES